MKTLCLDGIVSDDADYLPAGFSPNDLWSGALLLAERSYDAIVLSSDGRAARDLYRLFVLLERFVADGGIIKCLPGGGAAVTTAAEAFVGVHADWVIEDHMLRRCGHDICEFPPEGGWRRTSPDGVIQGVTKEGHLFIHAPSGAIVRGGADSRQDTTRSGRRVVSVAAFGDARYWSYLPALVRAHHAIFPGYELRVHHDDGIYTVPYGATLLRMRRAGLLTLARIPPEDVAAGICKAMLHRLAPAWDPTVDYVFCRDLDSLPTWIDRCACEEFIQSKLDLHVIHAQSVHVGIMGGLSGFRSEALRAVSPNLEALFSAAGDRARLPTAAGSPWAQRGEDQRVMNEQLAPKLPALVHSLFTVDGEVGSHRQSYMNETVLRIHGVSYHPAAFFDPRVSDAVRTAQLTAYPGAADYDAARAIAFFDQHLSPDVLSAIRAAENDL